MTTTEASIDIDVPIHVAYNQWTQFEEFPHFMTDVQHVEQLDNRRLHWTVNIAGVRRDFNAEITEQHPDERIAWRSVSGMTHAGVVTFHKLDQDTTRIMFQLEMAPQDAVEATGEATGAISMAAKRDLRKFKEFIESRGTETGAWRGDVPREG